MTATQPRLLGFQPFLRKELTEWWQRRAALITFLIVAALGTLGTLSSRIDMVGGDIPEPGMLDATANVLASKLDQWVVMAAIFASIGLLIQERATGTLGWTLSKPISRWSVLLAKWTAAVMMLATFAVILPLACMTVVSTLAYGSLPDIAAVARFGGVLIALPALFVAINLALATRLDSQAGIAATAIAIAFAPSIVGAILPTLGELWPTSIATVATAVALAEPVNPATVGSWALTIAVLAVIGRWAFNREDL